MEFVWCLIVGLIGLVVGIVVGFLSGMGLVEWCVRHAEELGWVESE